MGIRAIKFTGDNPMTAAAIAAEAEAGVDDFLAQATPGGKLPLLRNSTGRVWPCWQPLTKVSVRGAQPIPNSCLR